MKNTGAVISPCERYRYRLWRTWNIERPVLCFVMLNPSTADASKDDPTIRRCIGFAERLGYGGIEVANLFAWRATYPEELRHAEDPVGPTNDAAILNAARTAAASGGRTICAWGANASRYPNRAEYVHRMLIDDCIPPCALRLTAEGYPSHPLMLPYSCEPSVWWSNW